MANAEGTRTALVTGGSRGIGRGIVERLLRDRISVVFSYARNKSAADEVLATPHDPDVTLEAIRADLAEPEAPRRLYDAADEILGGLDVLVNNAATGTVPRPLAHATDDDYDTFMAVNTRAVFVLMREAATRLRDGGRIVNISTVNTVRPAAAAPIYAASKAAIEQFAFCAAQELGPRGITVNAVSPGFTDTDLLRDSNAGMDIETVAAGSTPLGRLGRPDDVADVVGFLVGHDGRWITGQTLRASGGV